MNYIAEVLTITPTFCKGALSGSSDGGITVVVLFWRHFDTSSISYLTKMASHILMSAYNQSGSEPLSSDYDINS